MGDQGLKRTNWDTTKGAESKSDFCENGQAKMVKKGFDHCDKTMFFTFKRRDSRTLSGEDCDVGIVAGGGAAFASIDRV